MAGFGLSSVVVILFSILLGGVEGITKLAQLILLYPGNLATTAPQSMMNWRALAINLDILLPSQIAWGITIAGIIFTLVLVVSLWLLPVETNSKEFQVILLATYAATCTITWHSHIYMALPLNLMIVYLLLNKMMSDRISSTWMIGPSLVFLIAALIVNVGVAHDWIGIIVFFGNLYFVIWATIYLRQQQFSARLKSIFWNKISLWID